MNINTDGEAISVEDQLLAVTELLGQVLVAVGEPVHLSYEAMASGLPGGGRIVVDDHIESEEFILYVEVPND